MEIGITEVYDMLRHLGAKGNHTGFFHTAYAVWLSAKHPERLLLVTKWLYPEVAKHYQTSWYAVEGSIRRTIREIWEGNRDSLEKLAGRNLERRPRPAQFLGILTENILKGQAA